MHNLLATVTLPDSGVDPSAYGTALLTQIGVSLGVAVGITFTVFAVWYSVKTIKRMTASR